MESGREPVIHDWPRNILGIKLHVVPVIACQVHEVDTELEFGSLERVSATGNPVFWS